MTAMHHGERPGRTSVSMVLLPAMFLSLVLVIPATAGEMIDLQLIESNGVYHVRMVMQVNAPARYVRDVLTDYVHIYRLNPSIIESEVVPSPGDEGTVRVRTRILGCLLFFCRQLDRVEDVRELPSGELHARIIPEHSDFRSGSAVWMIQPMAGLSQVVYQGRVEPDFAVPPLIGDYVIMYMLRRELQASFGRLECIARVQAGLDRPSGHDIAQPSEAVAAGPGGQHLALLTGEDTGRGTGNSVIDQASVPFSPDCLHTCDSAACTP